MDSEETPARAMPEPMSYTMLTALIQVKTFPLRYETMTTCKNIIALAMRKRHQWKNEAREQEFFDGGDAVGTPLSTAGTPSVHPFRRQGRRRYTPSTAGNAVGTPISTAGTPSVHTFDGGDAVGTHLSTAGTPSVHPGAKKMTTWRREEPGGHRDIIF